MWNLEGLIKHCNEWNSHINDKWVPARPLDCRSIQEKIREAYKVFTGEYDCFKWPEGQ